MQYFFLKRRSQERARERAFLKKESKIQIWRQPDSQWQTVQSGFFRNRVNVSQDEISVEISCSIFGGTRRPVADRPVGVLKNRDRVQKKKKFYFWKPRQPVCHRRYGSSPPETAPQYTISRLYLLIGFATRLAGVEEMTQPRRHSGRQTS